MDAEQIKDALNDKAAFDNLVIPKKTRTSWNTVVRAAIEYTDLIENSERIWWCEAIARGGRQMLCDDGVHDYRGCGWRTLTKEVQNES